MPETRKKYDREFREGAVRIVEETNKPIAQVARDLGVNEGTLGNWVTRAREARQGTEGLSKGTSRSSSGCAPRSRSFGWSVMSSSDPWSCGSRKRRGERGTLHRRPEDVLPGATHPDLPAAGGVGVVVLQVIRWPAIRSGGTSPFRCRRRVPPGPPRRGRCGRRRCPR